MGKTSLAYASMLHFAGTGCLPIFDALSGFNGGLGDLLHSSAGAAPAEPSVDGRPLNKAYILDGLDEVPNDRVKQFLSELSQLLSREPAANLVLTCRQAPYEALRDGVPPKFQEFFPLGFDGQDIRAYAGRRGLDPEFLLKELERTDVSLEASIPFVLKTLADVLDQGNLLENTRSDNLALVVDEILRTGASFGLEKRRRALESLGLSMVIYSRTSQGSASNPPKGPRENVRLREATRSRACCTRRGPSRTGDQTHPRHRHALASEDRGPHRRAQYRQECARAFRARGAARSHFAGCPDDNRAFVRRLPDHPVQQGH